MAYAAYLRHRAACADIEQRIAKCLGDSPDAAGLMRELRAAVDRRLEEEDAARPRQQRGGGGGGGLSSGLTLGLSPQPSLGPTHHRRTARDLERSDDGYDSRMALRMILAGLAAGTGAAAASAAQSYVRSPRGTVLHLMRVPAEYRRDSGRVSHRSDWVVLLSPTADEYRCYPVLLSAPGNLRRFVLDLAVPQAGQDAYRIEALLQRIVEATPSRGHAGLEEALSDLASVTRGRVALSRMELEPRPGPVSPVRLLTAPPGSDIRRSLQERADVLRFPGSGSEAAFCAVVSGFAAGAFGCVSVHVGQDTDPEGFAEWLHTACLLQRLQRTEPRPTGILPRTAALVGRGGGELRATADAARRLAHLFVLECLFDRKQTADTLLRSARKPAAGLFSGGGGSAAHYANADGPAFPRSQPAAALDTWLETRRTALFGAVAQLQTGDEGGAGGALERASALQRRLPEEALWFYAGEKPPRILAAPEPYPLLCDVAVLSRTYEYAPHAHAHCGARLFLPEDAGTELALARDRKQVRFVKGGAAHLVSDLDAFMAEEAALDARVAAVSPTTVTLAFRERRVRIENPLDPQLDPLVATEVPREQQGGGGLVAALLDDVYGRC